MKLPTFHLPVRAVVLALLAVAAIVALPAAPALAAPAISCAPDSATINEGGHTTIRGTLNDSGTPIASANVGVFQSTNGGSTWTSAGTAPTDSAGAFHLDVSPSHTTTYQCRYTYVSGGIPVTHVSATSTVTVRLLTHLSIGVSPGSISYGDAVTVTTLLTESDSGAYIPSAPVSLWFSTDGGATWQFDVTVATDSTGHVAWTEYPLRNVVYQWRWSGDPANAPATSANASATVVLKPATVTCGPVDATIDEGASTHINGRMVDTATRAAVAGAFIFLDESTDGGAHWTSFTGTHTGSDGKFQFTVSPTGDKTYRCTHAADDPPYALASSDASDVIVLRTSTMTIAASPTSIVAGGSTTLSTTLSRVDDGVRFVGRSVSLWASTDGGTTWTSAGDTTTGTAGTASLTKFPTVSTTYQWRYAGDPNTTPATSPDTTVTVSTGGGGGGTTPSTLDITTAPGTVSVGGSSTVTGYLHAGSSAVSGRTLTLKSSTDGGVTWTTVAHETTDASGHASHTVTPTVSTFYLWTFDGDATYDPSTSVIAGVTVSAAGTAPTTLSIATDPASITAGGSSTISGKLLTTGSAAVSGRTVRLDASTDGGATWTTVHSATSDGSGKVEVSVSPSVTTSYQWVFAGDASYDASYSSAASVTVVPDTTQTLTEHVSRHRLAVGQRLRVKGAYSEPAAGTVVSLYRLRHRGPVLLGTTHLDGRGHYRFRLHPDHRGSWRLRAEIVAPGTTDSPICRVRVQ